MRSALVRTNETCNHQCAFCTFRRPSEDPVRARGQQVAARIEQAIRDGAEEIVLSGGEPTLRRDLPALVAHARRLGASRVVLETNASVIDDTMARALARAGLTLAQIHLPATGEVFESIVGDTGSFAGVRRGIQALAEAGIPLEASVPVVAENREVLPELARAISELARSWTGVVLRVPVRAPTESTLLPLADAAASVLAFDHGARRVGLRVRLDPGSFIPPCVFPNPVRTSHLYALNPGGAQRRGFSRTPECAGCRVEDRCPGFPEAALAREPSLEGVPIREDRLRRRLTVVGSVDQQIARELVTPEPVRAPDGTLVPAAIVRIRFLCNQSCDFCFVSTHLPDPDRADVERAIREIGAQKGYLALSGGEPTLHPDLLDYVRLAKDSGVSHLELQTNATRLGDGDLAHRLEEAGVDSVFVSLHGSTAETSDAVTGAPGTWEQTVRGLDTLATTGMQVRVNFVMCGLNMADFPSTVRLMLDRWPKSFPCFSFVAPSTDLVPRNRDMVPKLTEALPFVEEGFRLAEQRGVRMSGLESMCSIPLCLLPLGLEHAIEFASVESVDDRGEFLKPEICGDCAVRERCWGIRRGYAELYGTGELRPIAESR